MQQHKIKITRKADSRLCIQHHAPFRNCPDHCGHKFLFQDRIKDALKKRSKLSIGRQKRRLFHPPKQQEVVERLCQCGAALDERRRLCDSCRKQKLKARETAKNQARRKTRLCKKCGTQLAPRQKKYCSPDCRPKQVRISREVEAACLMCNSLFKKKHINHLFCSRKCVVVYQQRKNPLIFPPIKSNCPQCGSTFTRISERHRFCSQKCTNKSYRLKCAKKKMDERLGAGSKTLNKSCAICSQEFTTEYHNKLFCSKKCSNKSNRIKQRLKDRGKERPLHIRVKNRLSSRLRELLRRKGHQKKNAISTYMGCSPKEMVAHIESQLTDGMTWNNYGVFGWHLDHIIPCQRFDLTKEDHCKVCFNWRNIRPLWGESNWNRQEMLTLDEALSIDPELIRMVNEAGVKLW